MGKRLYANITYGGQVAIGYWQLYAQAGATTVGRGQGYLREGRVTIDDIDSYGVKAAVSGSFGKTYRVYVTFTDKGWNEIDHASCNCPAWDAHTQMCKHVVATTLAASMTHDFDTAIPSYVKLTANVRKKLELNRPSSRAAFDLINVYAEHAAKDAVRPSQSIEHNARMEVVLHYSSERHPFGFESEMYLTF
jgi:uncharacterized Zn finger protein